MVFQWANLRISSSGVFLLGLWLGLSSLPAQADSKVFNVQGASVILDEVSSEMEVTYRAMRLNRSRMTWNVEVTLKNKGSRNLTAPFLLYVDRFLGTAGPLGTDGYDPNTPTKKYYDLSSNVPQGVLKPGVESGERTLELSYIDNAQPILTTLVYAQSAKLLYALALARSLDDSGQPLPGVAVDETGSQGSRSYHTDPAYGVVTLGQAAGLHTWKFSAPGYLSVWRQQALTLGDVAVIPSPRLMRRATTRFEVTPLAGGLVTNANGSIQVRLAPGALGQRANLTLTPLTGQTLPALLPLGWSPLQAFWLEAVATNDASQTVSFITAATATVRPWGTIAPSERVAWVHWNPSALRWEVAETLPGQGTGALTVHLASSGAYALVVGDAGVLAPPSPQTGQPLSASSAGQPEPAVLQAGGTVEPPVSLANRQAELVTAQAQVSITNSSGPMPSGLVLRCEVKEHYQLRDGTRRFPPQYENFVIGYQRPGDDNLATVQANFPLRPLLLLGADELVDATITVDVLTPTPFTGGVLDSAGGEVAAAGLHILAQAGDIEGTQAVQIRDLSADDFQELTTTSVPIVRVFDLSVAGVAPGRRLDLQVDPLPTNQLYVLARVLAQGGRYGLEPIERLQRDARGQLTSLEPGAGERLAGLTGAGQYALVVVETAQGFISGTTKNATGLAQGGWAAQVSGQPWLSSSDANGVYRLIAPLVAADIWVSDPATGDTGWSTAALSAAQPIVVSDVTVKPAGPRVVNVTPANGAQNVALVTPVVIQFSKAVNPGTLGANGMQLLDAKGQTVTASLTLNLANTVATLLPTAQLAATNQFTVQLSPNIADGAGRKLEGPATFTFTTASDSLNRVGAQVISYEPTNGVALMVGSPGTADPESPVILVNETTGTTATVLSKVDGSFTNTIDAEVDDFLSATLVNRNGARNTIPVSKQIYRDGGVALFNGGGMLEAQSDGGPVQVIVEPGAIDNKTKFNLQPLSLMELLQLAKNTQPADGGQIVGGFNYRTEGDELKKPAKIKVPMAAPPPGEVSYALALSREVGGVVVYEIIDKMTYKEGHLETASPPFKGLRAQAHLNRVAEANFQLPVKDGMVRASGIAETFHNVAVYCISWSRVPVSVYGGVYSAERDANGVFDMNTKRIVRGAIVLMGALDRIDAGALVAVSDTDGHFAAMANGGLISEGKGIPLRALSAFYPGQYARGIAPIYIFFPAPAATGSVFFDRAATAGPPDLTPPSVYLSQQPQNPAVMQDTTFRVFAMDNGSTPQIQAQIVRVVPVDQASQVSISETGRQNYGESAEVTYLIRGTNALNARIEVTAVDGSGNLSTSQYWVRIGQSEPAPVSPDPNDTTSPMVRESVPSEGVQDFNRFKPILLRFSEPVDPAFTNDLEQYIQLDPQAGRPRGQLSLSQKELELYYPQMESGVNYTLTVTSQIRDLSGNHLDQNPDNLPVTYDSFSLQFKTQPTYLQPLAMGNGAGAVGERGYIYALERASGGARPKLKIFHDNAVGDYVLLSEIAVNDYPRDLALIKNFSYIDAANRTQTANFIAVAGGMVGSVGQVLQLIQINDPAHPQLKLATYLTKSASAAVNRLVWSSPMLGYLENDGIVNTVGIVDLQLLLYAAGLPTLMYQPLEGRPGVDKDGDGNYTGANDILPLPRKMPGKPTMVAEAGLVTAYTLGEDSDQYISDFSLGMGGKYAAVVFGKSSRGDPPGYQTLAIDGVPLQPNTGVYPLAERPDRVFTVFGVLLRLPNGDRMANVALVSGGTPGVVTVLDITRPTLPVLLSEIAIPPDSGRPKSATLGTTGLIYLATTYDVFVLDPSRLGMTPATVLDPHPAIAGIIKGAGTGARSFAGTDPDFVAISQGGHAAVTSRNPPPPPMTPAEITAKDYTPLPGKKPRPSYFNFLEIASNNNQDLDFTVILDPSGYSPPDNWPRWTLDGQDLKTGRVVTYKIPGYSTANILWFMPLNNPVFHSIKCENTTFILKVFPEAKQEIRLTSDTLNQKLAPVKQATEAVVQNLRVGPFAVRPFKWEGPKGLVIFSNEWKERANTNKVGWAYKLSGSMDPLFGFKCGLGYGFDFPEPVNKWFKAQIFVDGYGKMKFSGSGSKDENGNTVWAFNLEGEAGITAGIEAKAIWALEATAVGEAKVILATRLDADTTGVLLKDTKLTLNPLNVKVTFKALGGIIEFRAEYPVSPQILIFGPRDIVLRTAI